MNGISIFLVAVVLVGLLGVLVSANPATLARWIKLSVPGLMIVVGALLTVFGRGALGIPIAGIGLAIAARVRNASRLSGATGKKSSVRSAALEMELDLDTGDMDGTVLVGEFESARLSTLDEETLLSLHSVLAEDGESLALLEAYLDRRFPTWREAGHGDTDRGHAHAASSGPMNKEEAYEVLGLEPGAGRAQIRDAHRRLMKRVHPDGGGSTFLAAKINQAKDVLLGDHG